jgi:IS1 family transposase
MSYLPIIKKTQKAYVWIAVDRVRNKIIDFEVSESRDFGAYYVLALRVEGNLSWLIFPNYPSNT